MVNAASPQTLTFLLTDIEGSTPLWDTNPEAMRAATERHNAVLRAAIAAHGGNAFRVVGDAFCVAFPEAHSAILAAVDGQRAMRAHAWGEAPIHVRMGLHSGAVEPSEDEIFRGPSLARAARVMSAAHGDQILATAATVALLERDLLPGGSFRDLGDHTLRGFARPERVYQVVVPGLRSEFPPIRTQEAQRTNLPRALTAFIGREQAIADVREAARRSRLLTLVGSGGTGKTRLAIEAASDLLAAFADGVWLVELATVADAGLVAGTIATTLGARAEGDVAALSLVETALADRNTLLLLDNCEHVVEEVANIAHALLRALPRLHILATSREALGVDGEAVYRVPSMTMPGAEAMLAVDVARSEAGALFVERARVVAPTFALSEKNAAAVARVCRRLDGIPLAIELAAARLTALSIDEVARRVEDRFRLLTGGLRTALPRQRTLRALVDWSYDLLSADERLVIDALAVFSGGFTLDAAEAVCPIDALRELTVLDAIERLVAKSLVIAEAQEGSATRYHLLETIRQYTGEKLAESGRADAARRRHFDFFLDLAERAAAALEGLLALEWLDRVEAEHDNVRAALDWSASASAADYARLAAAMTEFWDTRGHFTEGWSRLERAIAVHTGNDDSRLRALIGAGEMAYRLDQTRRSDEILSEAVRLASDLGAARLQTRATLQLAVNRIRDGPDEIERLARRAQAQARATGDAMREAYALLVLGRVAVLRSDYAEAQRIFLDSARRFEAAECVLRAPLAILYAGGCALEQLDFSAAHELLEAALIQHRRMGNVHDAATTLRSLAELALNEQRLDDAQARAAESLRTFRAIHDSNCSARSATVQASVLCAMGNPKEALGLAESVVETYRRTGAPRAMLDAGLRTLVQVQTALGNEAAARKTLVEALITQRTLDRNRGLPGLLEQAAAMHPESASAPELVGSAAALRQLWQAPVMPIERKEHERCLAAVREAHEASDFERAIATGRSRGRDEAIDRALELLGATTALR